LTSLHEVLNPVRLTAVVDVGAAHIDSAPPYHGMQQAGLCIVVGFEPQTALWPPQTQNTRTLPDVVGDGHPASLHVWNAPGMTGLFPPHRERLQILDPTSAGGTSWGDVIEKRPVATRRLDDIEQVENIDLLKIDAQGSEFAVIEGASRKLGNAVCVHAEMWFFPLYLGQPLFRDVDALLSKMGFVFHTFAEVHARTILPLAGKRGSTHQIIHADAIYVRDFTRMDLMSDEQLKHLALIADHCYQSVHLAWRCIDELIRRGIVAMDQIFPKPEAGWWTEK
jgi:FkbM family methyltransferase